MRKSRRFLAAFSAITLLFSSTFAPYASENDEKFDNYSNMGSNAVENGYETPHLFRQNGVYSNMETFPLVVQNGVEYVPMSVFILYPYVEVNYSKTDNDFFLVNNKNNHYISFNVDEGIASTHDGDLLKMPTPIFNQTRYIPARTVAVVLGFESETYDDPENGIYAFRVSDGQTGQTIEDLMKPYIENNTETPVEETNTQPVPEENPNIIYMPEGWEPPNSNKNKPQENTGNESDSGQINSETQPEQQEETFAERRIGLCYTGLSYNNVQKIVDSLDKNKIKASFSFTEDEILSNPGLVRALDCRGHGILVTSSAEGTTAAEYAESFIAGLEEANEALKLVSKIKTRMCTLPYDMPEEIKTDEEFVSKIKEAGYLIFNPSVETPDSPDFTGSAYSVSAKIKTELTEGFDKDEKGTVTALVYCSDKTYYYTVDLVVFAKDYRQIDFFAIDEAFLYNN